MAVSNSSNSMESSMGRIRIVYHYLMQATGVVAALLFGLMAVLVFADVLLRNTGWLSLPWSVEVTEYMLMGAAFVAAPWLLYTNDHIRIDILVAALPVPARHVLDRLGDLLGLAICGVLFWTTLQVLLDMREQGSLVFKTLVFQEWWLSVPMAFAFGLLCIEFARRLLLGGRRGSAP
jgi:TRAP-type C4-dicarboxylate transport system permease small subunit